MTSPTITATGTYCLFDNQIHDDLDFNEHMFFTTLKAVDDQSACSASAVASTDLGSVLERGGQAYPSCGIMNHLTFPSTEHGHAPDIGWMPYEQWFVEPKDLHPVPTLKGETTQEFSKMRLPFDSSINDDILGPSSPMEIASIEEREYQPQQPKTRRQRRLQRIKPHSETHAYQLDRNRVAATAYRNRKKEEMEKVQHTFRERRNTNRTLRSTLNRLNNEAMDLQKEVLKHCNCVCRAIDCPVWMQISENYSETMSSASGSSGSTGSPDPTPGTNTLGEFYCVRSPTTIVEDTVAGFEH